MAWDTWAETERIVIVCRGGNLQQIEGRRIQKVTSSDVCGRGLRSEREKRVRAFKPTQFVERLF